MFYYKGIEDIIFNMHDNLNEEPDELIILSGYLGPSPVDKLKELPFKVTVIGGMYTRGVDERLFGSLHNSRRHNENLNLLFSSIEIHSKIYIWKTNNKILTALIGSANFSSKGLRSDMRESLAVVNRATYPMMTDYLNLVAETAIEVPEINQKPSIVPLNNDITSDAQADVDLTAIKFSYDIPLYSETKADGRTVPKKSGLNWGLSDGHVAEGDAYIRLPKLILSENQGLIPPFDDKYINKLSKKVRASDPIEIIWDDGVIMPASLEGSQIFNGQTYPKNLTSFSAKRPYLPTGESISAKSILDRYLRNRLGVSTTHLITLEDLNNYGRTTVNLSLIEDGVYYADFSV